jgi:hypothetical protein
MAKRSTGNPPSKRWRAFNSVELVADDEGKRRLSESAAPAGIDELRRNVLKIGGLGAPSLATLGALNNGAKAKGDTDSDRFDVPPDRRCRSGWHWLQARH